MLQLARREHGIGEWLAAPVMSAWRHRELIAIVVQRELAQRFRGSVLGWVWAVIAPLVMLAAYTALFSGPLRISNTALSAGIGGFALSLFAGLIIFNLFSEMAARAPNLLRENAWFLKKTIFPSDILAWIALIRALVYAGISFVVLLVFELALTGRVPVAALLAPVILIPFCMFLLGTTWFLAALGALTQDVSHVMATILPVFIFASPVFWVVAELPEPAQLFAYLNPLTGYMEMMRDAVLFGTTPKPSVFFGSLIASVLVFIFGHAVFVRYRTILIDVV